MPTETAATKSRIGDARELAAASSSHATASCERDEGAGDRRGARAAVGLQHVAVERDRALAERARGRHTRAASGRSGAGSPACGPLCLPRAASRSLRVWVARGSMPYSAVTQPSPLAALGTAAPSPRRRGAQHARVAELDQHRAFGVAGVAARDADRAQLVGGAAVGALECHAGYCRAERRLGRACIASAARALRVRTSSAATSAGSPR